MSTSTDPRSPSRVLENEIEELRARLAEAEDTLRAIRHGEVDALVVSASEGPQVFTLRGAEKPYRLLIEEMQEGAATIGPDGTILYCNRRFAEMAGTPLEAMMGAALPRFVADEDTGLLASLLQAGTTRRSTGEVSLRSAGSASVPVHLTISRLPAEWVAGACMVVATDLTERKQNQRLEVLVHSRTEALRESIEQLRRSERLASIGTFAAGIAHEINNPLNAILMTAQYALRFPDAGSAAKAFSRIVEEARRGGEVVKGVLKFARDEHTQKTRRRVNDVIQGSLDVAMSYLRVSGLSLDLALADGLPEVFLNPIEIEQVIVNLLKNAVEAAAGRVLVRVRTRMEAASVVVEVEDDGPGIDEDVLPRIFDPFFSTRRKGGGTGLGLSICHGIVSSHGGTIGVQSTAGKGTVFTITLPAAGSAGEERA